MGHRLSLAGRVMKPNPIAYVGLLLLASALAGDARAETRQLSWDAVTTYTDGTPIEASRAIGYRVYWSTDPWVAEDTLNTLASSTPATSVTFDPDAQGMAGYRTVYFTVRTVLSTGEESVLSAALPWSPPVALSGVPAAPESLQIARVSTSETGQTWKVYWDPVSLYANGTPITGTTVLYTLYWTTDAGLSPDSLTSLASLTGEPSVTFDPVASGMVPNQRVYFTARSVLGTGMESALSAILSWRVSNKGPGAPGNGRIVGKNKK